MTKAHKSKKLLLARIGITAIAIGVTLVLFELFLRREMTYVIRRGVQDSGGSFEMNPEFLVEYGNGERRLVANADVIIKNHYLSGQDVAIRTNALGFRGSDLPAKTSQDIRILVLGDSITLADYLPESETFPSRLEKILSERNLGKRIQVINSGVTNIGTEEEVSTLASRGIQLKPDLVLLAFYLNDSRPPWGFSGEIGDRGWLRRHSVIAETIYRRIKENDWAKREQQQLRFAWIAKQETLDWKNNPVQFQELIKSAEFDWGAAWDDSSWPSIQDSLAKLKQLSITENFKVLVVGFPVKFQIEASFLDDKPQQKLRQLAAAQGFEFFDLLPTLRSHATEELLLDQCHPNARGFEIISNAVSEKVLETLSAHP